MSRHPSWGNYPIAHSEARAIDWRFEDLPCLPGGVTLLPRGLGRSYGDSCLNDGGVLLETAHLDHLVSFDRTTGILRAEAGLSLAEILSVATPSGWFLPVSPGTKHVTLGGAIANDIHGKNHHRAGTFGSWVTRFELLRSDGSRRICAPDENRDFFRATIGGLGLTGLITWAEIRLRRVGSEYIEHESVRFANLDEFFELSAESDQRFEYTVAWVDCLARGEGLGRGLFLRGNHATGAGPVVRPRRTLAVPFHAPGFLLNRLTIRAFNEVYYRKQLGKLSRGSMHYDRFFYPLDSLGHWNRLYGKRGFFQYQCVVPHGVETQAVRELFTRIAGSGQASFLAVLKVFGDRASPGILSFPRPGVTLALDFANRGASTLALLETLDTIVARAGGRVYPAKDARMSGERFRGYFPEWRELEPYVDARFSSSFWRRVTRVANGEAS